MNGSGQQELSYTPIPSTSTLDNKKFFYESIETAIKKRALSTVSPSATNPRTTTLQQTRPLSRADSMSLDIMEGYNKVMSKRQEAGKSSIPEGTDATSSSLTKTSNMPPLPPKRVGRRTLATSEVSNRTTLEPERTNGLPPPVPSRHKELQELDHKLRTVPMEQLTLGASFGPPSFFYISNVKGFYSPLTFLPHTI